MIALVTEDAKTAAFFEQFDAYERAREQLKAAADGSDDERYCISNCADLWRRLVDARRSLNTHS